MAYWTPLYEGPLVAYSLRLAQALSRRFELEYVTEDTKPSRLVDSTATRLTSNAVTRGLMYPPDVQLFHMANDARHAWMLGPIHEQSGLVVMHDISLFDLYRWALEPSPHLLQLLAKSNGYDPALAETIDLGGERFPDRLRYAFDGFLQERGHSVVVHSEWARTHLLEKFPALDVTRLPLVADDIQAGTELDEGWRDSAAPTISVVGEISARERVHVVIQAFARVASSVPNAQVQLVGGRAGCDYLDSIRQLAQSLSIGERLLFRTDPTLEEIQRSVLGSRLIVALREPNLGAVELVIANALAQGRPVLTTDLPQLREFDRRFVKLASLGRTEIAEVADAMAWALQSPDECRASGDAAALWAGRHITLDRAVDGYVSLIEKRSELPTPRSHRHLTPVQATDRRGINFHADWTAHTGLAGAARLLGQALHDAGKPMRIESLRVPVEHTNTLMPRFVTETANTVSYPIDLYTLNVNEFTLVPDLETKGPARSPYRIGVWFWEFPFLPPSLAPRLSQVDEVWAGTTFVQHAFMRCTTKPVSLIPTPVRTPRQTRSVSQIRREFGIPQDTVAFFFSFDFNSIVARKNPLAVIEAFAAAFPQDASARPATLVVKSSHLTPEFNKKLDGWLRPVAGVNISRHLSDADTDNLRHACDVFVSLHRAEGFGLGIAESMAIGKPVIATAYSGNMDFTRADNSCLVGYDLREVREGEFPDNPTINELYQPGNLWAEPHLDDAIRWMRLLTMSEDLRSRIGAAAARTIATQYAPDLVAKVASARIAEIYDEMGLRG